MFVGANSTIIYDVTISSNVIIGAGSVVTKDIPDGSVAVGVPCKVIGRFEDFVEKRKRENIEKVDHLSAGKRNDVWDIVKGLGILFVVAGHGFQGDIS